MKNRYKNNDDIYNRYFYHDDKSNDFGLQPIRNRYGLYQEGARVRCLEGRSSR